MTKKKDKKRNPFALHAKKRKGGAMKNKKDKRKNKSKDLENFIKEHA